MEHAQYHPFGWRDDLVVGGFDVKGGIFMPQWKRRLRYRDRKRRRKTLEIEIIFKKMDRHLKAIDRNLEYLRSSK